MSLHNGHVIFIGKKVDSKSVHGHALNDSEFKFEIVENVGASK